MPRIWIDTCCGRSVTMNGLSHQRCARYPRYPRYLCGIGLVILAACNGPTAPTVGLGEEFVLAPGDLAQVEGRRLSVRFVEVTDDSRCPVDVLCIQAGDAVVHTDVLTVGAEVAAYELHTADSRPVVHDDVMITLMQLAPDPVSARTIRPEDYRATLRVTSVVMP